MLFRSFDGRPMEGVSGITGAGRIWHRVMRLAAERRPGGPFPRDGLVEATLCVEPVGPGEPCPHQMIERFVPGSAPGTDGADAAAISMNSL